MIIPLNPISIAECEVVITRRCHAAIVEQICSIVWTGLKQAQTVELRMKRHKAYREYREAKETLYRLRRGN